MSTNAEQFTIPCVSHGEGPFWDAANDRLLLVDMLAGAIVEVNADGGTQRHELGGVAAAIRARRGGGYVLAAENRFVLLGPNLTHQQQLPPVFTDPQIRMNDGGCDPQGRFYCGTMAYDETPGAGTLYRLDPDGSVHVTLREVTISNGLQWNRAGDTVYYADTPTGRVDNFDFDAPSGAFTDRRTFTEISGGGHPDGMAIDEEDGIWVALWGGSAVHRYDSAGQLDLVVELPVSNVTACTFGGPNLQTLFITTSRQGLDPDDQPDAGAVFRYDAGVRGAQQHAFAG
ncbi:MAG TPA: SMP-30/gluconolactonase/LRE family protein [Propionibacteriaceae bacterium]|nr:SMP-30/gluconolactonase/LRE family protein [Propionibacteriaceae bacterium]